MEKKKILRHFEKIDPVLYALAQRVDDFDIRPTRDYFLDLCEAIISQQLAEKVGTTICTRFRTLFGNTPITATLVLQTPHKKIRSIGTSNAKVLFIKDLAQHIVDKRLQLENIESLSHEEIIQELTQVKGIGPWTAEMFLIFSLGREDVFSCGDLGLQRAIQRAYKYKKERTQKQLEKLSKKWSPYRSYACRILWESLELL
ncbi:MAG: DNA-3-methyladenine glycosylase 2 family protein [Candidatus Pacebacteria bacterium]|nr:DNA-3-methyladenine glycosylase 2 family protein [Candidatus Paceibacterota bacterium]